jgi:hypothetical protein
MCVCVQELKTKIDEHYRVNMLLDNLPVTVYDLLDAVSGWAKNTKRTREELCAGCEKHSPHEN